MAPAPCFMRLTLGHALERTLLPAGRARAVSTGARCAWAGHPSTSSSVLAAVASE